MHTKPPVVSKPRLHVNALCWTWSRPLGTVNDDRQNRVSSRVPRSGILGNDARFLGGKVVYRELIHWDEFKTYDSGNNQVVEIPVGGVPIPVLTPGVTPPQTVLVRVRL